MSKIPFIVFPNYEAQVFGFVAARYFGRGRKIQVSKDLKVWEDCPEELKESVSKSLAEVFG